jgi:hypothetical protein
MNIYLLFFIFQLTIQAFLLFIFPFSLFIMVRKLYKFLTVINKDVYQYKITSFYRTTMIVSIYIFFGLVFNIVMVYISYQIILHGIRKDLKPLLTNILDELILIYKTNLVIFVYVIISTLLIMLLIILFWRSVHQYCLKQVFSLYLYLVGTIAPGLGTRQDLGKLREERQKTNPRLFRIVEIVDNKYFWYSFRWKGLDIIRALIFHVLQKLKEIYWEYYNIQPGNCENRTTKLLHKLQYLLFSKWLTRLFLFSPLLVFFYDCVFNDWVINNTIYWLTFFVPILQLYKIMLFYKESLMLFFSLVYDILYGSEIYTYIIPEKLKSHFDIAIMTKCQYIKYLDAIQNVNFNELAYEFLFEYDYERDIYMNESGVELKRLSSTIYVQMESEKQMIGIYVAGYDPDEK